MLDTYKNDLKWSEGNTKTIKLLRGKLKKIKRIDQAINHLHSEVFEDVDCLSCGNCCRTTGPMLTSKDIERLSNHLKIPEKQFVLDYLRKDEEGDFVFKSMPCPFLGDDNYCSVYAHRPKACRQFPHTDQAGQLNIYNLTRKNAKICPAVSRILQQLAAMK